MARPVEHDEIFGHDFLEVQPARMRQGFERGYVEQDHVGAALDQFLDRGMRRHDIGQHADAGRRLAELDNRSRQENVIGNRTADHLQVAVAGDGFPLHHFREGEQFDGHRVEALAGLGGRDRAGGAVEELGVPGVFERLDAARHRRVCQVQLLGRLGEAEQAVDDFEILDQAQVGHGARLRRCAGSWQSRFPPGASVGRTLRAGAGDPARCLAARPVNG